MSISQAIAQIETECRDSLKSGEYSVLAVSRKVGIHYQHLLKFRDGKAGLSPRNLDKLAACLQCPTHLILVRVFDA